MTIDYAINGSRPETLFSGFKQLRIELYRKLRAIPTSTVTCFKFLNRRGIKPDTEPNLARLVRITNVAAVAHFFITFPYYWVLKSLGATWLSTLVIPLALFFAAVPGLNHLGLTTLSRHALLAAINICVYLYSASLGMETSIHNVFFFTLISPVMLFHTREWKSILFAVVQPVGFWALLVWKGTWFIPVSPFGPEAYSIMAPAISATTALMLFACSFMINYSYQRSEIRLEQALRVAESHSREKSRFLATVSHEIRTPLNGIFGFLQSAKPESLPESLRSELGLMKSSGELLLAIINDILDFSKIESGRLEIGSAPFDIRLLLEECTRLIRLSASGKDLTVSLHLAREFPSWVVSDETRFRQVVMNLLNNANKFTSSGSIRIRAGAYHGKDGSVRIGIEVEDTGIGIDPEVLPRLFHAFSQADSTTTRRFGGTGLGLAISKRLANAMGGDIEVRSSPGLGSTFTFTIMVMVSNTPKSVMKNSPIESILPFACRKALLVEDNPINQLVARKLLTCLGFEVEVARNGREGRDMALTGHYDIVFMDIQMPEMDGIEATRAIRAAGGRWAGLPIVAMTANTSESDRHLYRETGMNGFIPKPIQVQEIRAEVLPLLQNGKPE